MRSISKFPNVLQLGKSYQLTLVTMSISFDVKRRVRKNLSISVS